MRGPPPLPCPLQSCEGSSRAPLSLAAFLERHGLSSFVTERRLGEVSVLLRAALHLGRELLRITPWRCAPAATASATWDEPDACVSIPVQGASGQVDGGFVHLPPGVAAPDGSSWMPAARKMFKTGCGDAVSFRMEVAALRAAQGCEGNVQLLAHSEAASSSGSDCEHEEPPLQLLLSLVEGEGLDVTLVRAPGS
jgi:hypothetical protein